MKIRLHLVWLLGFSLAGCISTGVLSRDATPDNGLTLTLAQPGGSFSLNQPIMLEARFLNTSSAQVNSLPFSPEGGGQVVMGTTIIDGRAAGATRQESRTIVHVERISGRTNDSSDREDVEIEIEERDPLDLPPGHSTVFQFDIKKTMEGLCVIDSPGEFAVRVEYEADGSVWEGHVTSNQIRIKVK